MTSPFELLSSAKVETFSVLSAELSERRVDLLVDLPELQQRIGMRVQAARQDIAIEQFKDHAAVMLVVVLETEERHHRWAQVHMVGEEIVGLSHT